MKSLTYDQKLILLLYKRFYKKQYPIDNEMTQVHINAQKMCFLLQLKGIDIGEFGYSWNHYGPFSPGLLAVLRSIDTNKELVNEYYKSNNKLTEEDDKKVSILIHDILLDKHNHDIEDWMELLGSLAFLSNYVLPGEVFNRVEIELNKKKARFNDSITNKKAWDTLISAGLLKSVF